MKKLIFLLFAMVFMIASCSKEKSGNGGGGNSNDGETEVEMTFLSPSTPSTRSTRGLTQEEMEQIEKGTPNENKVSALDLLIFKEDKFQYRRHATPFGPAANLTFKATMKADEGPLTVHFIANGRTLIEKLVTDGDLAVGTDWETIRQLLVNNLAHDFDTDLPMWGTKSGLSVVKNVLTHWQGVQLLRAVAGVDVYMDSAVTNFELVDGRLYFVPNKGFWAPSTANYGTDYNWRTLYSESDKGMTTGVGTAPNIIGPFDVATGEKRIANKFYIYDNDTKGSTYVDVTRQYTRLIVGGKYKGTTYYYPIDFVKGGTDTDPIAYDQITRNWKYLFLITEVSGPGYPDPETASKELPVHMTTNIFDWNTTDPDRGHAGFDGQYYVSLAEKKITLARSAGSTKRVKFASNANASIIMMNFVDTLSNGKPVETINMIKNDRFKIEKIITTISGNLERVTELLFTAIGDYQIDPALDRHNNDQIKLKVGNIVFTIDINQSNSAGNWEDGGNQGEDLIGKQ